MQKATETSVLGDFANARFEHLGVVTTFSRSGDEFSVRTEGPDGALHDYEIAYTFGVYPLQQYLIAFPGVIRRSASRGTAARKSKATNAGSTLSRQQLKPGTPLHWTGVTRRRITSAPTATRPICRPHALEDRRFSVEEATTRFVPGFPRDTTGTPACDF